MNHVRKLLAVLLSLSLVFSLLPCAMVSAEDSVAAGRELLVDWGYCGGEGDGTNLRWEFIENASSGGILKISGSGAMADYEKEAPWATLERERITCALILEEGITHIGANAFSQLPDPNYSDLATVYPVVIPDSVESIGAYAFFENSLISSIHLGKGLKELGEGAFRSMSALRSFESDSPDFTAINGLLYNSDGAVLLYCPKGFSKDVVFADTVTSIGDYAFYGCFIHNYSFVIPDSVTEIGKYAFCDALFMDDTFTVGRGINRIDDFALMGIVSINSIESKSPNFCVIDGILYSSDRTELVACFTYQDEQLHIDENVRRICPGAFANWSFNGSLVLPANLQEIGDMAFENCMELSGDLLIPDSVGRIGANAFAGSGISGTITIGRNLNSIGSGAFSGMDISAFVGSSTGYQTKDGVLMSADGTQLVCWPSGKLGRVTIPDTVTEICDYAFAFHDFDGSSLVFPSGLKRIGNAAFIYSGKLYGNLHIPDGVTEIGDYAFTSCESLDGTLTLGKSLKTIGDNAFSDCEHLKGELFFPESLTTIGDYGFHNCSGLCGDLRLPEGLRSIGIYAFDGCCGFDGTLKLPSTLTELGNSAFDSCSGFKGDLVIPDGLKVIPSYAFYHCDGFDGKLVIGKNVERICRFAFMSCYGLCDSLIIPDSVEVIEEYAFNYCRGLRAVSFGKGVKAIQSNAFAQCSGLTGRIVLPEGLEKLDLMAFFGCSCVDDVLVIPENVKTIGSWLVADTPIKDVYFLGDKPQIDYPDPEGFLMSEDAWIHYNAQAKGWIEPTGYLEEDLCWNRERIMPFYYASAARFCDVDLQKYYMEPIVWAVDEGITTGKTATKFAPDDSCTRSQMVTFLWRAAGCPEPESVDCSFEDVDLDAYYAKALLWASENGIVNGVGDGTFAPDKPVTRGQMATILYRYADGFGTNYNPFIDVEKSAYYYDAVCWAYWNCITTGVSVERFCPNNPCTRAQIVTFLYRTFHKD